jgi:hypothetical protein
MTSVKEQTSYFNKIINELSTDIPFTTRKMKAKPWFRNIIVQFFTKDPVFTTAYVTKY